MSKTCKNKALANGCIPEYKGIDDLLKEISEEFDLESSNKRLSRREIQNSISPSTKSNNSSSGKNGKQGKDLGIAAHGN